MSRKPSMVDITAKNVIVREAEAYGRIKLRPETISRILEGKIEKGDPLTVASIAGIQAAKLTPLLLPMCHPIEITKVDVECRVEDNEHVGCRAYVKAVARTGVEMEALTAVTVALLNVWDMVKKYEKDERGLYPHTVIEEVKVTSKVKHGS
ncbi:cyclic pyranopterin monophosphate synthase MoaC [Hyperthermus butylicus]|uniref:Molybdenum cofactor biosynthesis protein C n=1 Tax=Hyperthermus butylicus (strain DSM 5456 / JCM 9403 / PLM1-5) TaxID=415426 RepID=A2BL94_HYPBU|nr:cyclic pyranopterin monophosphate synthase MoaC [Hyperthermus butylicus]ABM80755.1 Molybdenum cofactor biosynthesis protein C [Hyperthermus butylicus DSM 5456]